MHKCVLMAIASLLSLSVSVLSVYGVAIGEIRPWIAVTCLFVNLCASSASAYAAGYRRGCSDG